MAFGDYQYEIYLHGLAGVVPSLPMAFAELEAKAAAALPPSVWSYVAGGAGDERTQRANCDAFERPRDLSTANFPQLRGLCLSNYTSDPVFRASLQRPPEEDRQGAVLRWVQVFGNPLTWDDLPWLRSLTNLPLIVKGICHPDDARRAKDGGVDGIYCSNHGGRQANGGLPALDCLRAVVEAADGLPVLFDSGVRSGADVIKALALGATAVGIGRPYAYGLALGGVDGVVHVLRTMLAEADLIMAVDGYPTLKDLTLETLRRVD